MNLLEALKEELKHRQESGQDVAQIPEIIKELESFQKKMQKVTTFVNNLKEDAIQDGRFGRARNLEQFLEEIK